jgi:hypothetical protein
MVFANIDDHRKPFLSAMFAIISLSTATFVYLAVDGHSSIEACGKGKGNNSTSSPSSTTAAPAGSTTTTGAPTGDDSGIDIDKYHAAVIGGVVICALLAVTSVAVVLSVYCRAANVLKGMFVFFCLLTAALLYPMIVFGQALDAASDCKDVGVRLVPASVALFVVGLTTLLFFQDTLKKIRYGEDGGMGGRLLG